MVSLGTGGLLVGDRPFCYSPGNSGLPSKSGYFPDTFPENNHFVRFDIAPDPFNISCASAMTRILDDLRLKGNLAMKKAIPFKV
jgi:hypothetical protein